MNQTHPTPTPEDPRLAAGRALSGVLDWLLSVAHHEPGRLAGCATPLRWRVVLDVSSASLALGAARTDGTGHDVLHAVSLDRDALGVALDKILVASLDALMAARDSAPPVAH